MGYESRPEMETPEYKAWRFGVFQRDGWICVKCGLKGKEIEAHHIHRWVDRPELRYVVSNGITLCKDCHELVTGHEDMYEAEFKKIVGQKKFEKGAKHGAVKIKKTANPIYEQLKKWRPRNPRNFY